MINLDLEAFLNLAEDQSVVMLYEDWVADAVTPLAFFRRIEQENSFILESVDQADRFGRYAFIGYDPQYLIQWQQGVFRVEDASGQEETLEGDPFDLLKQVISRYTPKNFEGVSGYHGGPVGYLAYEMVQAIERLENTNPDPLDVPDMAFIIPKCVAVFDLFNHTMRFVYNVFIEDKGDAASKYAAAQEALRSMYAVSTESAPLPVIPWNRNCPELPYQTNMSQNDFHQMVKQAKHHIQEGDTIQVVVSQRFALDYQGDAFGLYRSLRLINPSPYMFCIHFNGFSMVGSSPEILVREEKGDVIIRPIAGTRPRGQDLEEDQELETELLQDEKEIAEHVMLVDLARNDIGRVCQGGTVQADQLMFVERYSHVMHIVSNVTGQLDASKDAFDLIRATFPAGTVSGAPKVRAMEIIHELEPDQRGPYAGAVCYFDYSGNFDSCITIRTAVLKGDKAYVQAGAGIVFDSDPEREYIETLNKARAMFRAIAMTHTLNEED